MTDIRSLIAQTAAQEGIDPSYALAVAERESGFNPNAHASRSIYGLFQMSGKLRAEYGAPYGADPVTQTRAWAAFTRDLKDQMTHQLGRVPTNSELYLGHYWGADRAARALNGGDSGMQSAFTPQELALNPELARATSLQGAAGNILSDIDRRQQKYGGTVQLAANGSMPLDFAQFGQPMNEDEQGEQNFARNKAYLKPGANNFATALSPDQEQQFRGWVQKNNVPFNPDAKGPQDYDMRGFWQGLQQGDEHAKSAIDPNDNKLHYPDYWKTPYHPTFSNESQWANPQTAPRWNDKDQLVTPDGNVLYDDRAQPKPQSDDGGTDFSTFGKPQPVDFTQFGQPQPSRPGQEVQPAAFMNGIPSTDQFGEPFPDSIAPDRTPQGLMDRSIVPPPFVPPDRSLPAAQPVNI